MCPLLSTLQEHTKHVEYLHENEMVVITRAGYVVSSLDMESPKARDPSIVKLELSLEAIEKGGYKHFMLKVRREQRSNRED